MAKAVVTIRIMPESPDVNYDVIKEQALKVIADFAGEGDTKVDIVPIAFGLNAINIIFVMEENLGSPDALEESIIALEGVNSFEVTDVRRAIG